MKIKVRAWDKYLIKHYDIIENYNSIEEMFNNMENSFLEVISYQVIEH